MISIIHPSRSRANKSLETLTHWKESAAFKNKLEIIISVDDDDPQLKYYQENASILNAVLVVGKNNCAVQAINRGAEHSKGRILIVVSDDTDCPKYWDSMILAETVMQSDFIVKFQDGIQDWIITMPVMDRVYYNRFGYIYYPEYKHMFCDTELTAVAELTGRLIKSDFLFRHNHYSVGGIEKDSVSEKADATWTEGERVFVERSFMNFGIENPVGSITNTIYKNWIDRKQKEYRK